MNELLELREWAKEQLEKLISEDKSAKLCNDNELIWDRFIKKLDEIIINY